jgi:hypothetical protein
LAASRRVIQEVSVKQLPENMLLTGMALLFLLIILLNVAYTGPPQ